jgi:hypothetical protein
LVRFSALRGQPANKNWPLERAHGKLGNSNLRTRASQHNAIADAIKPLVV